MRRCLLKRPDLKDMPCLFPPMASFAPWPLTTDLPGYRHVVLLNFNTNISGGQFDSFAFIRVVRHWPIHTSLWLRNCRCNLIQMCLFFPWEGNILCCLMAWPLPAPCSILENTVVLQSFHQEVIETWGLWHSFSQRERDWGFTPERVGKVTPGLG